MTAPRTCPKCRSSLPADAPAGICPRCLMAQGFETTVGFDAGMAQPPEPGETFGPYRIGPLLGSGGMGAVYEATHLESGRHVALKVLNHKLESPEHRLRFLREGRMAASINHPHSVYVFGTEEIGGTPVIAMELARGGTLQDRVKREGPLPVREAVDLILQIIDGLEVAEAAGVLHRDVKPSNCFLDADGTVKIGDYGLSISTAPRAETNLTQTGVFLGTPAFSSPEQLRGDELDVRSDIYSVGVTLFYILTARTPFEAKQMVQLLATVLEQPAPSPAESRTEIPAGLARLVQRCLAKRNTQRFKSYEDLREALLPYASEALTPAALGFRVLAAGIDSVLLACIAALLPLAWVSDVFTWRSHFDALFGQEPDPDSTLMLLGLLSLAISLGYFTLLEGILGTTPGKAMCRLRVVRADREPPAVMRAFIRSSIFLAANMGPWWIWYGIDKWAGTNLYSSSTSELWMPLIGVAVFAVLFSTIRRRNGYAAVHELASGTRVVRSPGQERRPALELANETLPATPSDRRIGLYHVLGELESSPSEPMILGYDTQLLRKVWIRICPADAPSVSQPIRELARIGRLRWLNSQRSAEGGWDAYEAPSGQPLLQVIGKPQTWDAVRFWLRDLAEELAASRAEGTLPAVLDLDRVWITADGRAKLLDFRAPRLSAFKEDGTDADSRASDDSPDIFLKRVAIAALEGTIVSSEEARSRDVTIPMPVSARALLNGLGQSVEATIPVDQFKKFTDQPASVTGAKRKAVLASCWLLPLGLTLLLGSYYFTERDFLRGHPQIGELAGYLSFYQSLDAADPRREAVSIVVADRFRDTIVDHEVWNSPGTDWFIEADSRRQLENFLTLHAGASEAQVASATARLSPYHAVIRELSWTPDEPFYRLSMLTFLVGGICSFVLALVAFPSLLFAILLGDSPLLRSLDIAIVRADGVQASRWRVLWRITALWTMVFLALGLIFLLASLGKVSIAWLIAVAWIIQMFTAERGAQDWVAGTYLVPR